ncbi:hypothetical protein C8F01DRAFT_1251161 [Mycena amicta]|nr:hypothetical protein C8F01DRAFT_1251161 [Mycena amicta]
MSSTVAPRRHLELNVFASPRCKLVDVPAIKLLDAAKQLFLAVLDAFRRGFIHGNISMNNILYAQADYQLLIIDWELGRRFVDPFVRQNTLTGTLDTMSVANFMRLAPLPHDEIESAIYVLLKIITQTFKPTEDLEGEWMSTLRQYHWDDPRVRPGTLQQLRRMFWGKYSHFSRGTTIRDTLDLFRSSGRPATAQFLHSLFSLPLPIDHDTIDSSDYNTVLSSLEDLVVQAVAAVDSVDASGLAREMEKSRLVPVSERA